MRSFHFPGRSAVYARRAMCATSHPLATQAAIEMLRSGGNAVDAAITAAAVLCVVEHPMTGIGGDCFAIIAKPGQKLIGLNASGRAPKAATPEWYAANGIKQLQVQSPHAVTVPGAIDGWMTLLADHGTKKPAQVLAPAIGHAKDGFVVAPRVSADWAVAFEKLRKNKGAALNCLKHGRAPRVGEVMHFPALGRTLRRIADEGREGFYAGEVAADMVAELTELGGLHTLEDFAVQRSTYVDPISVAYRGIELHELPPNNQGIVALMLLKMLEKLGPSATGATSPDRYHTINEAARLAYAARDTFVADPDTSKVPVAHLLSDAVISDLVGRIDRSKRRADLGPVPRPAGTDTVCFSVVDEAGMAVSFINSLYADFGSGLATAKTGVVFHNRGTGFVLDPKHPNCIAPRKRPMHTLVPAMAMKDGQTHMAFGVMGAAFQPIGHTYLLSNMLDYGMDLQEAVDCPRTFFEGDDLVIEESIPESTVSALKDMGHRIRVRPLPWGGAQAIMFDRANGTLVGASDPRKDGMALGY
ncbi:MAG: gamma-glutamyltransferase [Hyphomicrobiaceae bacterium]